MTTTHRIVAALAILATLNSPVGADTLFQDNVAPLLRQRCVHCHNPTKSRGGLDLSTHEAMLKGGDNGPAIVVRDSARSRLVTLVSGPEPKMPKQGARLTADELRDLRKWIDDGADWPKSVVLLDANKARAGLDWWSLRPLTRPDVPKVKDSGWGKNPVDNFILAALEARGLKPSPAADRRTLIRRLTFNLHGLPPTPEEIDAFEKDDRPDAYERLVDLLLASPRYGERWGRYWLDVVHYGDTHGYDKDKRRDNAWPYRDYVIKSINDDKPYERFVKEQIAGDVIYPDDPLATVATGFVAAGPWDFVGHVELREGTVDKEKTRLIDRDDMVTSTIATFNSMTVHCARCHDHKFDPMTQLDYYRLQAVFAGVDRGDRPYEAGDRITERTALEKRRKELQVRRAALIAAVETAGKEKLAPIDEELKKLQAELARLPARKNTFSPTNGYHSNIEPKADVTKWVQVDLGESRPIDEVRLIPARPTDFPDTPGFGFPVRYAVAISDDPGFAAKEVVADHTKEDIANPGDNAVSIRVTGKKARYVRVTAERLWKRTNDYVFALAELQVESDGKNVALGAKVTSLDSIEAGRWSRRHLVDDYNSRQQMADPNDPRVVLERKVRSIEDRRAAVFDSLLDAATKRELAEVRTPLAETETALEQLSKPALVYALRSHAPRDIFRLHRGNVEQPREKMAPGALACVQGLEAEFKLNPDTEGARRKALAEWLASPKNILTWRSIVNRIWHGHFGKGIVDTPSDFGWNGSRPTHPELLDWLAVEFRDNGGSFKKLHRQILTSATYRQASMNNPDAAKVDGDNRYLWRANRLRLDAETVRDSVLSISGKLDLKMGGPGFDLFRFRDDHSPEYDHTAVEKITDPKTYRRTVYRFVVRSVPNPFLECLDAADPNLNTPVRNTTLTALQALALLNDPFMVRQAEHFAERLTKATGDPRKQIDLAYRLAMGRPATEKEQELVGAYAKKHGLAAACRLLFNANEFLFID